MDCSRVDEEEVLDGCARTELGRTGQALVFAEIVPLRALIADACVGAGGTQLRARGAR